MIFFKNISFIPSDFVAPDGTKIHVSWSVAECDPLIYTYYLGINDGPKKEIEWSEIYKTMHDVYGIPNEEIPDKYKPEHLIIKHEPIKTEPIKKMTLFQSYNATYVTKSGDKITMSCSVAESCPPQYSFYYSINGGDNVFIKNCDIFNFLTEIHGISPEEVDHYKNIYD